MALITRLSRLFHADMNAVLDQIEEPELLLKQAIREMEETLVKNEQQIKLIDLEHQKLQGQEHDIKQSLIDLDEQLKVCFESDKDELAHSLVKRKLETIHYLKSLNAKVTACNDNAEQLKTQLKEHQSQFNSMKQKAEIFQSDSANKSDHVAWHSSSFSIQDEDVEVAFLHEKQKWSQS